MTKNLNNINKDVKKNLKKYNFKNIKISFRIVKLKTKFISNDLKGSFSSDFKNRKVILTISNPSQIRNDTIN